MTRRPWTPEEDALVLAGRTDLDGRSYSGCIGRRYRLSGKRKDQRQTTRRHWTAEMERELLAGRRAFPGLSESAVKMKIDRMRGKGHAIWWRPEGPAYRMWSEEEKAALRAGAMRLPGRSPSEVYGQRKHLGLAEPRSPLWTEEQDQQLLAAPQAEVPGRTHQAKLCRLRKLGRPMPRLDGLARARQRQTWRVKREARHIAAQMPTGGVLSCASPRAPGFDLLAEILRAMPRLLPYGIREEAIAEAALLCLERGITPADAAKEALSRARSFIDAQKKHVELNDRYHHLPQWSTAA